MMYGKAMMYGKDTSGYELHNMEIGRQEHGHLVCIGGREVSPSVFGIMMNRKLRFSYSKTIIPWQETVHKQP